MEELLPFFVFYCRVLSPFLILSLFQKDSFRYRNTKREATKMGSLSFIFIFVLKEVLRNQPTEEDKENR